MSESVALLLDTGGGGGSSDCSAAWKKVKHMELCRRVHLVSRLLGGVTVVVKGHQDIIASASASASGEGVGVADGVDNTGIVREDGDVVIVFGEGITSNTNVRGDSTATAMDVAISASKRRCGGQVRAGCVVSLH